ncbi:MAG: glutathione-disulfide reductase [Rhodobiaceae bacterium]|nr:glutathione-disulfide reductase [Rhodobiaceae bacterium]MCC0012714.1 glutathione-disulfide reductase [Rhodobiaceae bacterium]MCC0060259.1 glutathione-disulfide reductase [Rhodobiaceae bacterium]
MSGYDYDLFVIGGGSGGVRAARIASQHGARAAITEGYRYGGTCVIRGCVPKKLMVYASRFPAEFEESAGFGWSVDNWSFDWKTLIANKDAEIARLERAYQSNLEKAGVTLFSSYARLEDAHTVRLIDEDRTVTAETILIATGGTPNIDESLPGREYVISSNEVFHLEEIPGRIVIAGGGYIAMEFASIFAGLGAETTLIYRGPEPLRGFDDEVRAHVRSEMAQNGVNFVLGETFTKIEKAASGLIGHTSSGKALEADQIMFAIGRVPATEGLGLESAGVKTGDKGEIRVDAHSRTNVPNIYAVGDVTDRVNLTPVAIREGHAFADSLYGGKPWLVDHSDIATAVFTTPEIGTVGLTEEQASDVLDDVVVYSVSFRPMKATIGGSHGRMLMKLLVDGATDRVVGCHVVGPDAGEMAQLLGVLVKMGATKADFDATIALHPSAAEELVTMRTPTRRHVKGSV